MQKLLGDIVLLGKRSKPTKVNELNMNEKKFTGVDDIAEGFNDFFRILVQILPKKLVHQTAIFSITLTKPNLNLLHLKQLLKPMLIVSNVSCHAPKLLVQIKFLVKLSKLHPL